MMRHVFRHVGLVPLLFAANMTATAATRVDCASTESREVWLDERWISVVQGRDDDQHTVRVQVWGPERIEVRCAALDDDADPEIVVTSRGVGSGPYYQLQIIDFADQGMRAWSYPSSGKPKVNGRRVELGQLPGGYKGAGTAPEYRRHVFLPEHGLVAEDEPRAWLQYLTLETDTAPVTLVGPQFKTREACESAARDRVEALGRTGQSASFVCQSDAELRAALRAITN